MTGHLETRAHRTGSLPSGIGEPGRAGRLVLLAVLGATSACATAPPPPPLDGVRGGERVHWNGVHVGMALRDVRALLGRRMPTLQATEDPCGEAVAILDREGREVHLGFTHGGDDGTLHTIVLEIPPGTSREQVLRALKDRIGDLRYRPSPYDPDLPEARNPKPLYVSADQPEVGVLVGLAEGRVWISALDCME